MNSRMLHSWLVDVLTAGRIVNERNAPVRPLPEEEEKKLSRWHWLNPEYIQWMLAEEFKHGCGKAHGEQMYTHEPHPDKYLHYSMSCWIQVSLAEWGIARKNMNTNNEVPPGMWTFEKMAGRCLAPQRSATALDSLPDVFYRETPWALGWPWANISTLDRIIHSHQAYLPMTVGGAAFIAND